MKLLVCLAFVIGVVCVQAQQQQQQQQLIPDNHIDYVVGNVQRAVPTLRSIVVNYTQIDHVIVPQIVCGIDQINAVIKDIGKARPLLLPLGVPVILVFTQVSFDKNSKHFEFLIPFEMFCFAAAKELSLHNFNNETNCRRNCSGSYSTKWTNHFAGILSLNIFCNK